MAYKTLKARYAHAIRILDKGWTRARNARTAEGFSVNAESPKACKWCAYGAMLRAGVVVDGPTETDALDRITHKRTKGGCTSVVYFNDNIARSRRQVQAIFRERMRELDRAATPATLA